MNVVFPQRKLVVSLIAALGFTSISPLASAADDAAGDYVPGRILVEARDGLSSSDLDKALNAPGHKRRKLGHSNVQLVELPGKASEKAMVERLRRNPHFKFVELDRLVKSTVAVNDPYIGSAWHISKISAPLAWDSTQGANVTVAILDSGINTTHPDLAPNLVAGYNFYDNNSNLNDVCGHGTQVAGAAAAATDNALGVAGVAGRARIMPVRVAYKKPTDGLCYASYSTIASGITWAADNGARIANVSYGGVTASQAVTSAANYMKSKGGLVFVSSGNTGTDQGYAPNAAMIVVGATDSNDYKASWSSFGSFVTLSAPGVGIWSTSGTGYGSVNGTSFAAPVAAGVGALMMSAAPSLTPAKIESLLYSTAADLGTVGKDVNYGHGRVNAAAAVQAAIAAVGSIDSIAPSVAINAPVGSANVSGLVAVDASAADNVGVARVELQVNGTTVASDTAAPYGFSWNSANVPNGTATLLAVAYDAAGNVGRSASVAVNVANVQPAVVADTTAPVVRIVNPAGGSVSGTVAVSVNATDNSSAAGISQQLLLDGKLVAQGVGGTLSYSWNTRKASAGTHTLQAIAKDAAGNTSTTSVSVTTR